MDTSARQEHYGDAYVGALASVAGFRLAKPVPDDDSVDWTIGAKGRYETLHSPKIDVQVKCPYSFRETADTITYRIDLKNYNDLRISPVMVPRLLIVVTIPKNIDEWVKMTNDGMILRKCAYWCSLLDTPEVTKPKTKKVSVKIPKTQRLTVESLQALMNRAGAAVPL